MKVPMVLRQESARDDELIRYLLGDLPEDEAERFDERSVVDDEFAERLRIVEDDLLDAYASGRLTGERRKRFEAFYLSSPRRRERAAFAGRLLHAADQEHASRHSAIAVLRQAPRWLPWAAAAAVALCVAGGSIYLRDARLRTALTDAQTRLAAADRRESELFAQLATERRATAAQESRADAAGAVALVLLPQTRGIGPVPLVAVGSESTVVPIELALDSAERPSYEVALRDAATNGVIWRSGAIATVRTRPAGLLPVAIPATLLKSQHYALDVVSTGGARGFVGSYAFEVVRR